MTVTMMLTSSRQVKGDCKNCLLIDIDRRNFSYRKLIDQLRTVGISPEYIRTDRTNRGWHVVIPIPNNMPPLEVICLQAILGSDRKREAMNYMRLKQGLFRNLLFVPK